MPGHKTIPSAAPPARRNIITDQRYRRRHRWAATTGNAVVGNLIGTDAAGSATQDSNHQPLGNHFVGILIADADSNAIAGNTVADTNDILYQGAEAHATLVQVGVDGDPLEFTPAAVAVLGDGGQGSASDNIIFNNDIGTDSTGSFCCRITATAFCSRTAATSETVSRNVISASQTVVGAIGETTGDGVEINGASSILPTNNDIGTDATGTIPLGNANDGVLIENATDNSIGNPGSGNIISANQADGVQIMGATSTANTVVANFIGTDKSGTAGLGNGQSGIEIDAGTGNTIGGASNSLGNLISGNYIYGVFLQDAALGNVVLGNFIGTAPAEVRPCPTVTSASPSGERRTTRLVVFSPVTATLFPATAKAASSFPTIFPTTYPPPPIWCKAILSAPTTWESAPSPTKAPAS